MFRLYLKYSVYYIHFTSTPQFHIQKPLSSTHSSVLHQKLGEETTAILKLTIKVISVRNKLRFLVTADKLPGTHFPLNDMKWLITLYFCMFIKLYAALTLFKHGDSFIFSVNLSTAQFFASSRLTYMNSFISVRNSVVALLRISDKFTSLFFGCEDSFSHTKNIFHTQKKNKIINVDWPVASNSW